MRGVHCKVRFLEKVLQCYYKKYLRRLRVTIKRAPLYMDTKDPEFVENVSAALLGLINRFSIDLLSFRFNSIQEIKERRGVQCECNCLIEPEERCLTCFSFNFRRKSILLYYQLTPRSYNLLSADRVIAVSCECFKQHLTTYTFSYERSSEKGFFFIIGHY